MIMVCTGIACSKNQPEIVWIKCQLHMYMFWAARGQHMPPAGSICLPQAAYASRRQHMPSVGGIPTMPPAGNLFNSLIMVANAVEFIG